MTKHQPILVTGIERSGSTIIARILQRVGVQTGRTTAMLENTSVKGLMDDFCRNLGSDEHGQYPLPTRIPPVSNWEQQVLQRMSGKEPWLYKSSRITQYWSMWHAAFPDAKWVIVRRKPSDIVESCMKTGYMRAFQDKGVQQKIGVSSVEEGWRWWIRWHEARFLEMIAAGISYKEIWPERMVDGDYSQIVDLLKWCGLEWSEQIIPMVEPLLWKGKQLKNKNR